MNTYQFRSYFTYWLDAVDAHSLHSPFYFDFNEKVIHGREDEDYTLIERLREKLLQNQTPLLVQDRGSGSVISRNERTIREIAKTSLSPAKFSRLYARTIRHFGARNVVELGTSLGVNTLYLAHSKTSRVTTFEGSAAIAAVARSTFEFADVRNIKLVEGDLDEILDEWIENADKIDLAFMDANHRFEPTLKYFNLLLRRTHTRSVIIVDDIHYTEEMENVWKELMKHPLVYGSIDVWRAGFLFLDPSLNKQHVVLQF